jgi:hypothetical protein
MKICHRTGVAGVEVGRVTGLLYAPSSDELSVEEPLEIRLAAQPGHAGPTTVAVTMRTPATGLLPKNWSSQYGRLRVQ